MIKILVIDDDLDYLETIKIWLDRHHYSVDTSVDGKDGLLKIKNNRYDLIIVDVIMPNINGIKLIETVNHTYPSIKSILVSGGGLFDPEIYLNSALNSGAMQVLKKPFKLESLLETVKQLTIQ